MAVVVLVGVGIFGVLAAMQVVVVVVHFVVVAVVVLVLHAVAEGVVVLVVHFVVVEGVVLDVHFVVVEVVVLELHFVVELVAMVVLVVVGAELVVLVPEPAVVVAALLVVALPLALPVAVVGGEDPSGLVRLRPQLHPLAVVQGQGQPGVRGPPCHQSGKRYYHCYDLQEEVATDSQNEQSARHASDSVCPQPQAPIVQILQN